MPSRDAPPELRLQERVQDHVELSCYVVLKQVRAMGRCGAAPPGLVPPGKAQAAED